MYSTFMMPPTLSPTLLIHDLTVQTLSLNNMCTTGKFWSLKIWLQRNPFFSQLVTLLRKVREVIVFGDFMKRKIFHNSQIFFLFSRNWSWSELLKPENRVFLLMTFSSFIVQVESSISHLIMNLKKLREVFVAKYVRNKNLFHFVKISFQLLRNPFGSWILKTEKC